MSTTYHSQVDDQTEVMNRILEQYLRAFVHDRPSQWYRFLLLAEWSYNTSTHSGTCISPFEAIYRKPLLSIPHYILGDMTVEAVDSLLATRTVILAGLRRRLIKAQTNMKTVANTHCRSLEFAVGNWVYVCLRPYRQTSFAPAYTKLAKWFYGPFQILERVGPVLYKLQLPSSSKIHPTFHISLLKLHHGPPPTQFVVLPPSSTKNHPIIEPLHILDWKWDSLYCPPTKLVLVQWNGLAQENTTWEPLDTLC